MAGRRLTGQPDPAAEQVAEIPPTGEKPVRIAGRESPHGATMIRTAIGTALTAGLLAAQAPASQFTGLAAFGDSFVDKANTAVILEQFVETAFGVSGFLYPPPPYADLQYSNGPTFAEIVGDRFEAEGKPFANFGHGSGRAAQLDTTPIFGFDIPDLADQRALFEASGVDFGPNALGLVLAGGNDIDDPVGLTLDSLPPGTGLAEQRLAVQAAVNAGAVLGAQALAEQIALFDRMVIDDFVLFTLADVGEAPRYSDPSLPGSAFGDLLSDGAALFNQTLIGLLPGLEAQGYAITLIDLAGPIADLQQNGGFETDATGRLIACGTPHGAAFGVLPLYDFTGCDAFGPGANERFWWDEIHPTAAVHAEIADLVLESIDPSVIPLPLPAAGLAGALLLLVGLRRRRG